jgi:hypothetical protein
LAVGTLATLSRLTLHRLQGVALLLERLAKFREFSLTELLRVEFSELVFQLLGKGKGATARGLIEVLEELLQFSR